MEPNPGNQSLSYENLWKAIVRPPRSQYLMSDLGELSCVDLILTRPEAIYLEGKVIQEARLDPSESKGNEA